ncbi:hypothetical protein D9M71_686090 [compost metagenome]
MRLNAITGAVLHKVGKHVLHQAVGFSLLEQGRDLANRQGLRAQALQFEAQALKPLCMLFGTVGFTLAKGQGFRHQQRLTTQALAGHGHLEALVHYPLVGSVHVHQHQANSVLGQDVDTLELRQGIA